jgi:hypothetical protein
MTRMAQSLPYRAISKGLAVGAWSPRQVLEHGLRFPLPDAPCPGCHLIRWGPWQQGLHRLHLTVDGRIRFQHGD